MAVSAMSWSWGGRCRSTACVCGEIVEGTGRKRFAKGVLALLVFFEDFACPFDDAAGKAREARDFDAVTFVRATGLNAAQKNNLVGRLLHRDVDILHACQEIGKLSEFVVVRGEKRTRARVLLQVLDDSPGDREAVKRRSTAADFIQQNEARRSGVVQDGGDLAHLDEKRRAAARQIIAGADAREDAVGDGEFG